MSVFEIEGENIRANHGALLSRDTANTRGGCAFLDGSGACRIYESRPYVCRTHGLPFRWEEWESEGENGALEEEDLNGDLSLAPPKEYRDICPLNAPGEDINALPPEDCLTLGDFEGQLAQIQAERDGWALKRVALRQLFPQPAPPQGGID